MRTSWVLLLVALAASVPDVLPGSEQMNNFAGLCENTYQYPIGYELGTALCIDSRARVSNLFSFLFPFFFLSLSFAPRREGFRLASRSQRRHESRLTVLQTSADAASCRKTQAARATVPSRIRSVSNVPRAPF